MKELILQGQQDRLRAALLEQGELIEAYEQEGIHAALVGNIYRGRVVNVLPGMQAAFVNIGLEKNAFLYVADALPQHFSEEDERLRPAEMRRVEQVLHPGQELIVQIIKEPVGGKGARITTNLTLPGRYTVLLPKVDYVGVSRKIKDQTERERLRGIAGLKRPAGVGLIVRTLAEGLGEAEISEDIARLVELWEEILARLPNTSLPGQIYRELDLVGRLMRDLVDADVDRITVDKEEVAAVLRLALREIAHPAVNRVFLDLSGNLFERNGVEAQIRKALQPKVWLKSGGYLVIEETEALTVVDVNTGKYTGERSLQGTVLRTNLEAAGEIARQLRLRNLGGIIVIDFIDMDAEADRQQVLATLETYCLKDKLKCDILGFTRLGLVEMTRKKVGRRLTARYTTVCQVCEGKGYTVGAELEHV